MCSPRIGSCYGRADEHSTSAMSEALRGNPFTCLLCKQLGHAHAVAQSSCSDFRSLHSEIGAPVLSVAMLRCERSHDAVATDFVLASETALMSDCDRRGERPRFQSCGFRGLRAQPGSHRNASPRIDNEATASCSCRACRLQCYTSTTSIAKIYCAKCLNERRFLSERKAWQ